LTEYVWNWSGCGTSSSRSPILEGKLQHQLANARNNDQNRSGTALVHEVLGKALGELGQRAEADAELERASQIRQQPQAASGKSAEMRPAEVGRSGQGELRSILLQGPRETTFSNLHESEYVKRVSALLGDAYDNLGVIDARAGR